MYGEARGDRLEGVVLGLPERPEIVRLIERSVLVQRSSTQVNFFGLEEVVDFVRFPCVAAAIWREIADNVINESLLDTLVLKLKKLKMN